MPTFNELFRSLAAPFEGDELAEDGSVLVGAICKRLDDLCDRDWSERYHDLGGGRAIVCSLTLVLTDDMGEVKKVERAGMADATATQALPVAAQAFRSAAARFGVPCRTVARPPKNDHPNGKSRTEAPPPPADDDSEPPTTRLPKLVDDLGNPVPTDRGNRLLGWLSGFEERRKSPKILFNGLREWAKASGYHDMIRDWTDDDPRIREAALWILAKAESLPRPDEPEDETQDAEPPPRNGPRTGPRTGPRNVPPPDEEPERPALRAFRVPDDDPLVLLKKRVVGKAIAQYLKEYDEPASDEDLCNYLNGIVVNGSPNGIRFTVRDGIAGYNHEKWLEYIHKELLAANAASNREIQPRNGRGR